MCCIDVKCYSIQVFSVVGLARKAYGSGTDGEEHLTGDGIKEWYMLAVLADRTNGRACLCVASVCRRLSVTLCIVAKRCILEQKLLLRAYRKSCMRSRLVPK